MPWFVLNFNFKKDIFLINSIFLVCCSEHCFVLASLESLTLTSPRPYLMAITLYCIVLYCTIIMSFVSYLILFTHIAYVKACYL